MELSFERRAPQPSQPLVSALEQGAWHGAWSITAGSLPAGVAYVVRYGFLDLPWGTLGTQLGTFVGVTGALYGAGIATGEAAAHVVAVKPPFRAILQLALPALFGALAGLGPGAFAAERYGRMSAPYFGTLEILVTGMLSFFLFGAARLRAEGLPAARAVPALGLALLAPLLIALGLWAVLPNTAWLVDAAVLRVADGAPSLAAFGAGFGAFVGALFGLLIGCARTLVSRSGRSSMPPFTPFRAPRSA